MTHPDATLRQFFQAAKALSLSASERLQSRDALQMAIGAEAGQLTHFVTDARGVGLRPVELALGRANVMAYMHQHSPVVGKSTVIRATIEGDTPITVQVWAGLNLFKHIEPFRLQRVAR